MTLPRRRQSGKAPGARPGCLFRQGMVTEGFLKGPDNQDIPLKQPTSDCNVTKMVCVNKREHFIFITQINTIIYQFLRQNFCISGFVKNIFSED